MRHWRVLVVAVALVAAGVVAAFALQLVRVGGHVPMPPSSASPEQVVRSYLEALDRHDCATAVALWTDPATPTVWCDDVGSISARMDGQLSEADPSTQRDVNVEISVAWRPFHDDGTLPPTFSWSFLLHRSAAGWRIYDNGQG